MSLYLPREKADFNFLDFVNDYEKTTGVEARVDFLLVTAELVKRRSLTFAQILDLTQRDDKRVDECIREWLGQDVVRLAAGGKAYALTAMSLKKMGRDGSYISDLEEAEIHNRALDYLERFGTIKRTNLTELCGISEKQASYILSKMAESGVIIKVGAGRATSYQLAPKIVPSV